MSSHKKCQRQAKPRSTASMQRNPPYAYVHIHACTFRKSEGVSIKSRKERLKNARRKKPITPPCNPPLIKYAHSLRCSGAQMRQGGEETTTISEPGTVVGRRRCYEPEARQCSGRVAWNKQREGRCWRQHCWQAVTVQRTC